MNFLELATFLLLLASIFSIINLRILKLPQTIGLMVLAIALSAVILIAGVISPELLTFATAAFSICEVERDVRNGCD